jgi:hypothetical protein
MTILKTGERKCSSCLRVLPLGEFYSHRGNPLGKSWTCKTCDKTERIARAQRARGIEALRNEIKRDEEALQRKKLNLLSLEVKGDRI